MSKPFHSLHFDDFDLLKEKIFLFFFQNKRRMRCLAIQNTSQLFGINVIIYLKVIKYVSKVMIGIILNESEYKFHGLWRP